MSERKARCDGEATREAILAAAAEEFADKGFDLGSIREICRKAGVNLALVNRYFGSKDELYRLVAERLFGELERPMVSAAEGACELERPMVSAAEGVGDEVRWRAAVEKWVDDFLYMTIPTAKAQRLCRGIFRHEVTTPTKFHAEFKRIYGKPVYDALWKLIERVEKDPVRVELITSSIWSQVAVYALADETWHRSFRPKGVAAAAWRDQVRSFICSTLFATLEPAKRF